MVVAEVQEGLRGGGASPTPGTQNGDALCLFVLVPFFSWCTPRSVQCQPLLLPQSCFRIISRRVPSQHRSKRTLH